MMQSTNRALSSDLESAKELITTHVLVHYAVVHHYQRMDIKVVRAVITSGLDDLIVFGESIQACLQS
jgi:uncharacterized protein YutE (UPF0331/DUF86 family)